MNEARPASDITDEDLLDYVDLIAEGYEPPEAARAIGTTGSVMRKFRSKASQWYDERFAREYEEAMASVQRADNQLERVRAAKWREIDRGNTTLITKELLARDPEWEVLRHQNFQIDIKARVLHRVLPHMTDAEIEALLEREKAELEQAEQAPLKALPAA